MKNIIHCTCYQRQQYNIIAMFPLCSCDDSTVFSVIYLICWSNLLITLLVIQGWLFGVMIQQTLMSQYHIDIHVVSDNNLL